jgi:hypothetical protein
LTTSSALRVPVSLELDNNTTVRVRVKVTGARSDIQLPPVPARPRRVQFNDLKVSWPR